MASGSGKQESGRIPVTAEWRAEMQRRRAAYDQRRRHWVDAWFSGTSAEPATDTESGGRGRIIHDKRQFRLDV
jgi:hypothetical protein